MRPRRFAPVAKERAADRHFSDELGSVSERGSQPHVLQRRRIDLAANGQNLRCCEDCIVESAGDVCERGQQEVAVAVDFDRVDVEVVEGRSTALRDGGVRVLYTYVRQTVPLEYWGAGREVYLLHHPLQDVSSPGSAN